MDAVGRRGDSLSRDGRVAVVFAAGSPGMGGGLVAALFIWFDPSVIVDAHIWPQWDVWMLPPFFLAALLATVDWCFPGIVLGVGVMFKGQLLMLGPVLALWPLLSGRYGALGRVVSGFVLATG